MQVRCHVLFADFVEITNIIIINIIIIIICSSNSRDSSTITHNYHHTIYLSFPSLVL